MSLNPGINALINCKLNNGFILKYLEYYWTHEDRHMKKAEGDNGQNIVINNDKDDYIYICK